MPKIRSKVAGGVSGPKTKESPQFINMEEPDVVIEEGIEHNVLVKKTEEANIRLKLKVTGDGFGSKIKPFQLDESDEEEDTMDVQKSGLMNNEDLEVPGIIRKNDKKPYRRFVYSEETLLEAIEKVKTGELTLNRSSQIYKVPKSTLYNKIWKKTPLGRKMGPTPVLSAEEENKFKTWIIKKAKLGFPVHPDDVKDSVQTFLKKYKKENPFKDDRPGKKWFLLFLQRHPEITAKNAEAVMKAYAPAAEDNIKRWFNDLKQFLQKEKAVDILDDGQRILNLDDLGYFTCPDSSLLLGPVKSNNYYEACSANDKECISVLSTFSADGSDLPSVVIYPYNRSSLIVTNSIPEDWAFGKTDTGWPISASYYEYIVNVLFPWLKKKNAKFPILLLMDGHKSRISYQLSSFCLKNKIFLYCLPPNATLIVQPCDIIFKPLKATWNDIVSSLLSQTGIQVDKENFSPLFYQAFKATIDSDLIKTAFRVCGIFPFDANAIDYSKCINLASEQRRREILDQPKIKKRIKNIDLQKTKIVIEKIVGNDKIKQFENKSFDHEDTSLYSVWQRCSVEPPENDDDYYVVVVAEDTDEGNPSLSAQDYHSSLENVPQVLSPKEKEKLWNRLKELLKPQREPFSI